MKRALIWGGDGGMGAALASLLLDEGWTVAATIHKDADTDPRLAAVAQADVADAYSVQQATLALAHELEAVDLWVYAVGDIAFTKVADLDETGWRRVMDANLTGAYLTFHASQPLLADDAHLVFIGALTEQITLPRLAAYAAAKAGLEAFAVALAKEQRKLRVTVVRPGAVDTPLWNKMPARLPKNAMTPDALAEHIVAAYHAGTEGALDV